MAAGREPMSGVDLAWLRMERPTNPMMVVGVLTCAARVPYHALRAVVIERLLRFERFRQRPLRDALGGHWDSAPDFDIDWHLRRLTLPARTRQEQLEAAAGELASTQLDPRHPMWQIHLVERYGRGSALIVRFHHCYADGIALLRVLLSLTDLTPMKPRPRSAAAAPSEALHGNSRARTGLLSLVPTLESALSVVRGAGQGALELMSASLRTLAHPEQAAVAARQLAQASAELASIAMLSAEPQTPLKQALSAHKQLAWGPPLSLELVKAIGQTLGCTINDVLLACASGALAAVLAQQGFDISGLKLRGLVPVNLRPPEETPVLGNHFGLVFVNLPIGEHNPLARLYLIHQDMQRLKASAQPALAYWLLSALGTLPGAVEERGIELLSSRASVVISNVPGPRQPLYLAGARIAQQFFWVPQAGSIGVGMSLLTYDNHVHFGVIADRNLIAAPRDLVQAFVDEFERLQLCVVVGPWGNR